MTAPENGKPAIKAQLVVTLYDGGSVNVQGPIDNRLLSYGMLEVAKELIFARGLQEAANDALAPKPDIVVAPANSVPPFRPKLS